MRAFCLALLLLAAAGPAFAADCTKDVLAAFEKQRTSKAFRVEFSQQTAEGEVHMKVDYMPPDRMLQTVTSPADARRTADDARRQPRLRRARAGHSRNYFPNLRNRSSPSSTTRSACPQNLGTFECRRKMRNSMTGSLWAIGRPKKFQPGPIRRRSWRGRFMSIRRRACPAFNVIAALSGNADPALKIKYSYPTRRRDRCAGKCARAKAPLEIYRPLSAPSFRIFLMRRIALVAVFARRFGAALRTARPPEPAPASSRTPILAADEVAAALEKLRKSSWFTDDERHAHRERPDDDAGRLCASRPHASESNDKLTEKDLRVDPVGNEAWSRQDEGSWTGCRPISPRSCKTQMQESVIQQQKDVGAYSCKGRTKFDGHDVMSYKLESEPEKAIRSRTKPTACSTSTR